MRIGNLAAAAGLRPSALRYWESIGLLAAPPRVSGRRSYGPDALNRVRLVTAAQRAGFTLREVRALVGALGGRAAPSARWRAAIGRKLLELRAAEAELRATRRYLEGALACACESPERCGWIREGARGARIARTRA